MVAAAQNDKVRLFLERHMDKTLFSTGARLVDIEDVLYNISGSTDDPQEVKDHEGKDWKKLLTSFKGLNPTHCYVDNVPPEGPSSHPNFSVGGHMTLNPSGEVEEGGISYLMPLCYWHNHTARNNKAFEHEETTMLELTGFMEGETPITFLMRLPEDEQGVLLYFNSAAQNWQFEILDKIPASTSEMKLLSAMGTLAEPAADYAMLEKTDGGYRIVKSNLNTL